MAEKKVACPWCGAEMEAAVPGVHKRLGEPYDIYCSTFYVCKGCGATGPRTEVIIGDDDGLADKTRECMEKAYTDALRCPFLKPLALGELMKMEKATPVWMEAPSSTREPAGGQYVLCKNGIITPSSAFSWNAQYMLELGYVFLEREPTSAERSTAAWKC